MSVAAPGPGVARPPSPPVASAVLGLGTRLLHWGLAAALIGLLAYGFWLGTVPSGPGKGALVQAHKSLGMVVFALALVRLAWRWREGFPRPLDGTPRWEARSARAVHLFLIAATILMPASGILRSLAYARPVSVFGVAVIPQVFEAKQETLYALSAGLHDGLALALAAAIALHAAAALKHHWIDRDRTLARMLGRREVPR